MTEYELRGRAPTAHGSDALTRRAADSGPPVDAASPFAEHVARENRRVARDPRPKRHLVRAAFSWLAAVGMVVAAVYGGFWFTGFRLSGQGDLAIGQATLAATSVEVPAPGNGQVSRMLVRPSQEVVEGDLLFQVRIFGSDGRGRVQESVSTTRAPVSGVVSSVLAPEGSAVRPGQPVLQMYDPRSETFEATVDAGTLGRLRRGMRATLTAPGVPGPITAVVDHVVSAPAPPASQAGIGQDAAPASPDVTLVLRPLDPAAVDELIPGIQFDAVVDTRSGPRHASTLLQVGS